MEIRFTTWRNCGLGFMVCPPLKQAGIIFIIWSIVLIWGGEFDGPDGGLEDVPELKVVA